MRYHIRLFGKPDDKPEDRAFLVWDPDREKYHWEIELRDDAIVTLSEIYDVMLIGSREVNTGSSRNPMKEVLEPLIILDRPGGRFKPR